MSIIFLAYWLGALSAIVWIANRIGIPLHKFSLPSFIISALLVFQFVGFPALYFMWFHGRAVDNGVNDLSKIFNLSLLSGSSILLVEIGILFGRICLPEFFLSSAKCQMPPKQSSVLGQSAGVIIAAAFCLLVFLIYVVQFETTAIEQALFSSENAAMVSRSAMTNAFPGKYHWYQSFMHYGLQFLTYASYGLYLIHRSRPTLFIFLSTFFWAALTAVVSMEKGPLINVLMGLVIVHVIIAWNGSYKFKRLFLPAAIAVASLVFLFSFSLKYTDSLLGPLVSIASRTFTGQIVPAYWYLEYFPRYHEFLLGRSFPNPMGLFTFAPYNLTQEIWRWKHPILAAQGVLGSAPAVFWGEVYANFGTIWIFVSSFFVGFAIWIIHWLLMKLRRTPLDTALIAWCTLHYMTLASTGLSRFVVDTNLLVVMLIYLVLRIGGATFALRR